MVADANRCQGQENRASRGTNHQGHGFIQRGIQARYRGNRRQPGSAFESDNLLTRLNRDDLPRFQSRFKELLNVNTINEIANFNGQLARQRETIKDRIAQINQSLSAIDYNPGRYIVLESQPSPDAEIRDFQQELRACTEGAVTGSDDVQYSDAKFLQVKAIIDRFRGRAG